MQEMCDIVDGFAHRDKMLMPKYVINAANDEFFLPTDTRYVDVQNDGLSSHIFSDIFGSRCPTSRS